MRRYGYSNQDGHLGLVDYHGSGSIWSRVAVLDFRAGEMGHSWIILGVSGSSDGSNMAVDSQASVGVWGVWAGHQSMCRGGGGLCSQ